MYLLEFNAKGVVYKITPDAPPNLNGIYVDKLPTSIEKLKETFNEIEEGNTKYYIKKENE